MAVTVFEPTYRLTSLDMTLLKIISKGNTEAFDDELVDWVKDWRCKHMNWAKALLLNLMGPDVREIRAAVSILRAQGFIYHYLEPQEQADGPSRQTWDGIGRRKRIYCLTKAGQLAVGLTE